MRVVSKTRLITLTLCAALLAIVIAAPRQTAHAAALAVTVSNDELDAACATLTLAGAGGAGDLSLREAICIANINDESDTITLLDGVIHPLDIAGTGEDGNATGDLDIVDDVAGLDVIFTGTGTISQDAATDDRVLDILSGAEVQINGLSVITGGGNVADGGGIQNAGTLSITGTQISSNTSTTNGGGIMNSGASSSLTLDSSIIGDNTSNNGGGIYNEGTVIIQNFSTIGSVLPNTATLNGGGIANASGATLTITDSGVDDNISLDDGGGIWNEGTLTLDFAQVSGNTAASDGGGIDDDGGGAVNILNFSRVNGNTATAGDGGGIDASADLTVDSSFIFDNIAGDEGGGIFSNGNVFIQNFSVIDGNTATTAGGGIYSEGTLTVDESLVSNNGAPNGGGIYSLGDLVVDQSVISDNGSVNQGAGIWAGGPTFIQNGTVISNNNAGIAGGGIFSEYDLAVSDSILVGNTVSSGEGGAVYWINAEASANITSSCIFENGDIAVFNGAQNTQTATGNWWGSATGPTHSGNIGGMGDSVSDFWDYSGFLTTLPTWCTPPDLAVSKTNNTGGVADPGETFNWTITITNEGDGDAYFSDGNCGCGLILWDYLPLTGATYGAPSIQNASGVTGTITCDLVDSIDLDDSVIVCIADGDVTIAPGGTFQVVFPVTVTATSGQLGNPDPDNAFGVCEVDPFGESGDENFDNDVCADTVGISQPPAPTQPPAPVVDDPALTKRGSTSNATLGETVTWTLIVSNPHAQTINNVVVNDPIPAEFAIVSTSTTLGTTSVSGNTVSANVGTLNPGQSATITIVTTAINVPATGTICNIAQAGRNFAQTCLQVFPSQLPPTGGGSPTYGGAPMSTTVRVILPIIAIVGMLIAGAFVMRRESQRGSLGEANLH